MEHVPQNVTRHGIPNEMDQLPKGSLCTVITDHIEAVYKQMSEDSEHPRWELIHLDDIE